MDNKQHQIFRLNVEEEQQAGRERRAKSCLCLFLGFGVDLTINLLFSTRENSPTDEIAMRKLKDF